MGFCFDKFGFQKIMKIITIFIIIFDCYFIIFLNPTYPYVYVAGLYISCIFRGGVMACITPHVMQIYGLKYYLLLGGFLGLFNALCNFMIAMISAIISIWYHNSSELLLPYRIVCGIGVIFAIIGLVFVFQEDDTKFRFDDEKEEETKEENKIKEKGEKSEEETSNEVKEKNEDNKNTEKKKLEKMKKNQKRILKKIWKIKRKLKKYKLKMKKINQKRNIKKMWKKMEKIKRKMKR